MAFQDIITIESPQFYIDFAFKAAKKRTDLMRSKKLTGDKLNIIRQIYLIKIETVESKLVGKLDQILQSFPRLDDLDDFYKELVKDFKDCYMRKQKIKFAELKFRNWQYFESIQER